MWFQLTYTFLGGLGLFFFGMKTLSESMQAIAGDMIKNIIKALTTNRIMAVLVGTAVTVIVQSSSVTTVMVVGMVNAGLMNLAQAIGVIFGANIGTTITGWIIAIKVGKYGLLFVAVGAFPMLFSSKNYFKNLGKLLFALGFVFIGLKYMSGAFKPLKGMPEFISILHYFSATNFVSLFACVLVGAVLTFIIQSSSAMLAITVALALSGTITYQTAVALVFGENIGTTITALLASIGTNSEAKRAARAHAIFNILGVLVLMPFFWKYIDLVDYLVPGDPNAPGTDSNFPHIATHIASSHTFFNVLNTLIFLPFLPKIAKLVVWLTPAPDDKEIPQLKYITAKVGKAPKIAILTAEKEMQNLADITGRCIDMTRDYVLGYNSSEKLRKKIDTYEEIGDKIQAEITLFLLHTQKARLNMDESTQCYKLIRAADELESVSDYCASLARYRDRLDNSPNKFSDEEFEDLRSYFDSVIKFYWEIKSTIEASGELDLTDLQLKSDQLTDMANKIRENHRLRMNDTKSDASNHMLFSDMIIGLRKLKGHSIKTAQVLTGTFIED